MKISSILPHAVAINEVSPLGMGTYRFVNCPPEFGQFFDFPRFKDFVVVYKTDGIVEGYKGETYQSPMNAKDTYRKVSLEVKRGELVFEAHRNFKEIIGEPSTISIPIVRL